MTRLRAPLALLALAFVASSTPASAAGRTCRVEFRLDDDVTLSTLETTVDYTSASGQFATSNSNVSCSSDAADSIGAFGNDSGKFLLSASWVSLVGVDGPTTLGHCTFEEDSGTIGTDDFHVHIVSATDLNDQAVPTPNVSVHLPDCNVVTTTTTTLPTTTTTTLPTPMLCDLTLRVTSTAHIGSLDWTLDYTNAFGDVSGVGKDVACTSLRSADSSQNFNDFDSSRKVLGGLISLNGFTTPADIAVCTFEPDGLDLPIAGDFSAIVRGATDTDLVSLDPAPKLAISKITCHTAAVCGDAKVQTGEECDDGNTKDGDGCDGNCKNGGICGDADENTKLQSADALRILKKAIGQNVTCPIYVCDTDKNASIQAADALRTLKKAIGQNVTLVCSRKSA